ncbi:MAG: metallophosphoesterase [Candidatus Hydrogenedentes bacterium]|nr:metallophosphoesterase [Candidatus Hydrogenedentota bacterium]
MVRILHISDSHAERESMQRLANLAALLPDCDVVAHTGDCVSLGCDQLPSQWDEWPHKLKLAVPGNHDRPHTFDLLPTWRCNTPWSERLEDLAFLGLDGCGDASNALRDLRRGDTRAVILLMHWQPHENLLGRWYSIVKSRPLLILHGHDHPNSFSGRQWDDSGSLEGQRYFRSHVCSSVTRRRGLGNLITWTGTTFECEEVQGPRERGPLVRHPKFGTGFLVKRDEQGEAAKVTVYFACGGEKRFLADRIEIES